MDISFGPPPRLNPSRTPTHLSTRPPLLRGSPFRWAVTPPPLPQPFEVFKTLKRRKGSLVGETTLKQSRPYPYTKCALSLTLQDMFLGVNDR